MAVKKAGENYKCNICGNEVTVTTAGGGELVCCGEPMELVE
jgi:desulfoferrodoxin-like iron-binding protein